MSVYQAAESRREEDAEGERNALIRRWATARAANSNPALSARQKEATSLLSASQTREHLRLYLEYESKLLDLASQHQLPPSIQWTIDNKEVKL